MTRKVPALVAILFVVALYVFAGSVGRYQFKRIEWWESSYASLSEGFLHGRTSLMQTPDPRLVALPDPYQPNARNGIESVHDASYYKGKFYLYFSPLPALLVYIPIKLITGSYRADILAGTIFGVCAFLVQAAFVLRALRGRKTWLPPWLWILFIGIGNLTLFILLDIWMYEVAVLCGMFFASLWAYALLRFIENATWRTAAMLGMFAALAIVSRPTLLILLLATVAPLRKRRDAIALAIPLLVIGSMYGAYNYARFGSPFETGQQYQLTNVSLREFHSCRLCTGPELGRFVNSVNQYLFRAPTVNAHFPFATLSYNEFDPAVSFPAKHEEVGGIVPIIPLTIAGTLAVILLWMGKGRTPQTRTATLLIATGWLTMFALSTCAWVTARYELDFIPALTLGALLAVEESLTMLRDLGLRTLPLRLLTILLAFYSIGLGILLGFGGRTMAFQRFNPELFARIASWFTLPP